MHTQTYIHTSTHTLTHIHMGTHMQAPLFPNYLGVSFPSHWTFHYTTITQLQPSVTNIDKVIYLIYHFCSKFTRWLTVCKSTSPQHASESRVVHLLPCLCSLSVYWKGLFSGFACAWNTISKSLPSPAVFSLTSGLWCFLVNRFSDPLLDDIREDSTPLAVGVSTGFLIKLSWIFLKSSLRLINNGTAFQGRANLLVFIYSLLYLVFTGNYSWNELG